MRAPASLGIAAATRCALFFCCRLQAAALGLSPRFIRRRRPFPERLIHSDSLGTGVGIAIATAPG